MAYPETIREKIRWAWYNFHNVGGSSSRVLGIPVFGNRHFDRRWFKLTVLPLYRFFRSAQDAKNWVRYRTIKRHKYHLVDTRLGPGYYDQDTRMLHACFSLLGDYIEEEGGADKLAQWSQELMAEPDKNAPEGMQMGQAQRQNEALSLWRWWTVEKPADEKLRDELLHDLYGNRRLRTRPVMGGELEEILLPEFTEDERTKEKRFRALEAKIDDDEQVMLHRLIDIRGSLWI